MKERHKNVYELIKTNEFVTINEIANLIKSTISNTRNIMRDMQLMDKKISTICIESMTKRGRGKLGYYIPKESGVDHAFKKVCHYKIYCYIKDNPYCNVKQITKGLDVDSNIILKNISEIMARHYEVEKVVESESRTHLYFINKDYKEEHPPFGGYRL